MQLFSLLTLLVVGLFFLLINGNCFCFHSFKGTRSRNNDIVGKQLTKKFSTTSHPTSECFENDDILTKKANEISANPHDCVEVFKTTSVVTGIVTVTDHEGEWRVLRFNGHPQAVNQITTPENINNYCFMEPIKVMLAVALSYSKLKVAEAVKVLIIGLGGGILPSQLERLIGDCLQRIDIIDIEPSTVQACEYLGVKTENWNIHIADAVEMINNKEQHPGSNYNFIFLDAFDGTHEQPSGILEPKFMTTLKDMLAENGVLITNFRKPGPPLHEMLDLITMSRGRGLDLIKVSKNLGSDEQKAAQQVSEFQRKLDAQISANFSSVFVLPVKHHALAITIAPKDLQGPLLTSFPQALTKAGEKVSQDTSCTFDVCKRIAGMSPVC